MEANDLQSSLNLAIDKIYLRKLSKDKMWYDEENINKIIGCKYQKHTTLRLFLAPYTYMHAKKKKE